MTWNERSWRKLLTHRTRLSGICMSSILERRPLYQTRSNAAFMLNSNVASFHFAFRLRWLVRPLTLFLLRVCRARWTMTNILSRVCLLLLNPDYHLERRRRLLRWIVMRGWTSFSFKQHREGVRLIER